MYLTTFCQKKNLLRELVVRGSWKVLTSNGFLNIEAFKYLKRIETETSYPIHSCSPVTGHMSFDYWMNGNQKIHLKYLTSVMVINMQISINGLVW